jgi:hypothetical protein
MTETTAAYEAALNKNEYKLRLSYEQSGVTNEASSEHRSVLYDRSRILRQYGFLLDEVSNESKLSDNVHELFGSGNWSHCLPQSRETWEDPSVMC